METTNIPVPVTLLEHCRISPPPTDAVPDSYLSLTFFDIRWLGWRPIHRLLLHDFPCSTTDFYQTLVPKLKHSLSLLLKHYFPFAGNLIVPSTTLSISTKPQIRYLDGDSVSLTIAECNNNLNHLTGNHARYVDDLFPLVPRLPSAATEGGCFVAPLFALQVTLFPNHGFTVGFTNSHVVGDGSTMVNFIREWASIAKQLRLSSSSCSRDDDDVPSPTMLLPLPFYDRSVIKDPKGLATIYWRHYIDNSQPQPPAGPTKDMVQATFIMYRADIEGLKNLVSTQLPTLARVSSYTMICAFVWTCMAKTRVAIGEVDDGNEVEEEHFIFPMDCRARLDPPIPATYFGNCVTGCVATRKSIQLVGEEGFVAAAEAIGEAIHATVNNKEGGVLKGAETWYVDIEAMRGQRMFGVAGSPKFDYYGADFGWGKPKRFEVVSEKFSLNSGGDGDGDVEIGLCFPKNEMDAFTTIFAKGLVKVRSV